MISSKDMERMDEIEFNLKDLVFYVCLRWKMILICMLVGAIVSGGIGALKAYSDTRAAKQALEMSKEESTQSETDMLESLKQELTEVEAAEVERVFGIYKNMVRNGENITKYNSESVKMKLNPYAVPTITLSYFIDTHYQSVYPIVEGKDNTDAIVASVVDVVTSNSTCEKILQELEWEKEAVYVKELISFENTKGLLTINLMAPSQEECEVMRDVIVEIVNEHHRKQQIIFGEFDITLLENEFNLTVNAALLSEQLSLGNSTYNLKSNYVSLTSGLLDCQKAYLNGLINSQFQNSGDEELLEMESPKNTTEEVPKPNLLQAKYIVLGALAGIIIYCLWLILKYILSDKLHTADEMEQRYCIRVWAEITAKKNAKVKNNFILDKILYNIFLRNELRLEKEDAIHVVQSEIYILAKNIELKNIYVASTSDSLDCKEIQELICKEIPKDSYSIHGGCNISCNPKALVDLGCSDGIVLIEQVNASSYEKIKRLVCFCEQNRIPIIGCAIIW